MRRRPDPDQLDLLPAEHQTTVYRLDLVKGQKFVLRGMPWYAWRCTCGRDVGAEHVCAYSGPRGAERMAWWHRRGAEPWNNPLPGPPA